MALLKWKRLVAVVFSLLVVCCVGLVAFWNVIVANLNRIFIFIFQRIIIVLGIQKNVIFAVSRNRHS